MFLDAEYETKVDELSNQYDDMTRTAVEQLYIEQCREIQQRMKDGTPLRIIRRLAFNKTESALAETDDTSEE